MFDLEKLKALGLQPMTDEDVSAAKGMLASHAVQHALARAYVANETASLSQLLHLKFDAPGAVASAIEFQARVLAVTNFLSVLAAVLTTEEKEENTDAHS